MSIHSMKMKFQIFCMFVLTVVMWSPTFAQDTTSVRVPKAQLRRTHSNIIPPTNYLDTLVQDSARRMQEVERALSLAGTVRDSMYNVSDSSISAGMADTLFVVDSLLKSSKAEVAVNKIKQRYIPDPKKAMWLAIVFPGGGQIYNHKYWKLPIIYGGFLGCAYAMNWNNTMYTDYSQAYIDIMDDDPNSKSYEDFLPIGYDANANKDRLKTLFKRKKDYYRRYRDLSIFCMIGVYALSVIDAYVDAELSSFDISKDLSMRVRPSVINNNSLAVRTPYHNQAYGVQCSLSF